MSWHNVKLGMLLLIAIFFLSVFLVQCISANDVTFEPESIFISGEKGTTIVESLNITNTNLTDSVDVNISTDAEGLTFFPDFVTLEPGDSVDIGIIYTLQTDVTYGNITFEWVGVDIVATVTIDEEENGGEEPPPVQAPVEIFPSPAKSGSSIAIFFTDESAGLGADGFLHVNGFIYRVEMEGGFGIVELDRDAYGQATLYLFGSAIMESDSTKTFDIEKGTGKDLNVDITETATINDDVAATVSYGGDPYGSQEVSVTSPSAEVETYITDNQGRIEFNVDEIGRWRVMLTAEGQIATGHVTVDYGILPLGIVEEEPPQVGDIITIVTDPEAHIEVFIDGEINGDFVASGDGFIPLSIVRGGRYSLEGRLGNLRGKYSFQVPAKANINILDPITRTPVERVENKKRYIVEVTNSAGQLIEDAESVWIANPLGTKELIPLIGGIGTWNPYQTGSYMLSVDDTASCAGNSRYVLIRPPAGEFEWTTGVLVAVLSLFMIFCLLIIYSKKRGIPLKLVLNSISGTFFNKKRKRPELPIG